MSESKKNNRVHNAIMAWHASPYDFDKFGPMRQVTGSGQGAAMFGRGVAYLAESKEVSGPGKSKYMKEFASHPATGKKHALSPVLLFYPEINYSASMLPWVGETRVIMTPGAMDYNLESRTKFRNMRKDAEKEEAGKNWIYAHILRQEALGRYNPKIIQEVRELANKSIPEIQEYMQKNSDNLEYKTAHAEAVRFVAKSLDDHIKINPDYDYYNDEGAPKPPFSYRVAAHLTPETLLDWDEPLARHNQEARRKIYEAHQLPQDGTGSLPVDDSDKGGTHYKALIARHGSDYAASEALYDAGIHGIRYKDGQSRNLKPTSVLTFDGKPLRLGSFNLIPNLRDEDVTQFIILSSIVKNLSLSTVSDIQAAIENRIRENPMRNPQYLAAQRKTLDWCKRNASRLNIEIHPAPKTTYNYVVFHPDLLEILAKYDIRGNLVKEYTPGAHLKSVDHDPFEDEHK